MGPASTVEVGDRVMVQVEYGTYAQEVLADESQCYPVPEDVSFEEAAAIGIAYQTTHFALVAQAHLKQGQKWWSGTPAAWGNRNAACEGVGLRSHRRSDHYVERGLARENGADHVIDVSASADDP